MELFPYLEEHTLSWAWDYSDYRKNLRGGRNATSAHVIKVLLCPSPTAARKSGRLDQHLPTLAQSGLGEWVLRRSHYGGNGGTLPFNFISPPSSRPPPRMACSSSPARAAVADITDGTSNTFLLASAAHEDAEYDRLTAAFDPGFGPLVKWGLWGWAGLGRGVRNQFARHSRAYQITVYRLSPIQVIGSGNAFPPSAVIIRAVPPSPLPMARCVSSRMTCH